MIHWQNIIDAHSKSTLRMHRRLMPSGVARSGIWNLKIVSIVGLGHRTPGGLTLGSAPNFHFILFYYYLIIICSYFIIQDWFKPHFVFGFKFHNVKLSGSSGVLYKIPYSNRALHYAR